MIEFDQVCFGYSAVQKQYLLNNINFSIADKEFVAIVGSSGSGKTTLIKLITNQLHDFTGKIKILNFNLPITSAAERRNFLDNIAVVLQKGALFRNMTVYENIAFSLSNQKISNLQQLVHEEMKKWQLDLSCANYYPYQLSGGMVQKTAIARANIIIKPLIIYDEPCAGLDDDSSELISRLMYEQHYKSQQTVVLITHNLDMAYKFADRIFKLSDGRLNCIRNRA